MGSKQVLQTLMSIVKRKAFGIWVWGKYDGYLAMKNIKNQKMLQNAHPYYTLRHDSCLKAIKIYFHA